MRLNPIRAVKSKDIRRAAVLSCHTIVTGGAQHDCLTVEGHTRRVARRGVERGELLVFNPIRAVESIDICRAATGTVRTIRAASSHDDRVAADGHGTAEELAFAGDGWRKFLFLDPICSVKEIDVGRAAIKAHRARLEQGSDDCPVTVKGG